MIIYWQTAAVRLMVQGIIIRNVPHPHSVWRDRSGDYGGTGNPTAVSTTPDVVSSVKNYPNPAVQTTNIEVNLLNFAEIAVSIFDISGKMVSNAFQGSLPEGRHVLPVNVAGLPKGFYIYTVKSNDKGVIKTISKQMIKM